MSESRFLDAKRNHAITEKCREAKWLWHGWFLPVTWQGFPTMVYYDIAKFDPGRRTLKCSNWNLIKISSYCHEGPSQLHQTPDIKLPVAARNWKSPNQQTCMEFQHTLPYMHISFAKSGYVLIIYTTLRASSKTHTFRKHFLKNHILGSPNRRHDSLRGSTDALTALTAWRR